MVYIITDDRNVDDALSDEEWEVLKRCAKFQNAPLLREVLAGEQVSSTELTDEAETLSTVPFALQKLISYALAGQVVRCQGTIE